MPRGFLTTFAVPDVPPVSEQQSGRLELAQWLTSPKNPLTPRVIANRVWAHLFGQGIVSTVDNFGVKGDVPTHPELLDYLANDFIRNGWSVKHLIKSIVLSHAYRLGGDAPAAHKELDPANQLVWRHSPRRLDAEEIRDSLLVASNRLQSKTPGESAAGKLKMMEMRDNGAEAKNIHDAADSSLERSVYLPLVRGVIPRSIEAFDPVTQSLVSGQRDSTTVPTQSLYFLNGTFVRQQSVAAAKEIVASDHHNDHEWIALLYQRSLGRAPTAKELERAASFLTEYTATYQPAATSVKTVALAVHDKSQETTPDAAANPDDIKRDSQTDQEISVEADTPEIAAWAALVQALFASAEFRFVR